MTQPLWMLPQGIEEILPPVAARIEAMRRRILDLHTRWGYELVYPPIVEHLESLLTGTGHALDLHTFKLIDPLSGRSLGVHADMTPQVARIDASRLQREGTVRLSYAGTVLRTQRTSVGVGRSPMQLGAELFGHQGVESDAEIVSLMLASLAEAGIDTPQLDLGHVGVYRAVVQPLALDAADENRLFDIMLRKARPELDGLVDRLGFGDAIADALRALLNLSGDPSVLIRARGELGLGGSDAVLAALAELGALVQHVNQRHPGVPVLIDLCELRGYNYHTGVVFSAYHSDAMVEIARGGRYDNIGASFGRARPATGFSCDLKQLSGLDAANGPGTAGILAPEHDEPGLWSAITALREQGERVVVALSADDDARALGCDRTLVFQDGHWTPRQI